MRSARSTVNRTHPQTGITTGASAGRIARLAGIRSRNTATATIEDLRRARILEILEVRRNRAHVYRIALTSPLPGAQDLSTQAPDAEVEADSPDEPESAPGAQDLSTRCSESEHPGVQDLSTIRSTDLSRSPKADPSGLGRAMPDESGIPDDIGFASSLDQGDHLTTGTSAPTDPTRDLVSPNRGRPRRVPRRRASRAQIMWVRDLRAMTGTGLETPESLTVEEADEEIRTLWPEIERRRHNGEPLDGEYSNLSPRARAFVDEHDLDIDRREAS